jgi:hypothetical protein
MKTKSSPGRIRCAIYTRVSTDVRKGGGVKYRYYLSSALLQGQVDRAGTVSRVPAIEIEAVVQQSRYESFSSCPHRLTPTISSTTTLRGSRCSPSG